MSKIITSLLCLFLPMLILAQPRDASGYSYDENGKPFLVVKESCDSLTVWLPQNVEYIRLFTQRKTARTSAEQKAFGIDPYIVASVLRLERHKGAFINPIKYKLERGTWKTIKKYPVDRIIFDGFELYSIGNEQDDPIAQKASAFVAKLPGHDYARRDDSVYYYRRIKR